MTDTGWIRQGARVAELTTGVTGNPSKVTYATIASLTATQIHLDNGRRYNRAKLRPVGEKVTGYTGWTCLKPVDDKQVRHVVVARVVRRLGMNIQNECGKEPGSAEEAVALIDRLAEMVTAARQAITGNAD